MTHLPTIPPPPPHFQAVLAAVLSAILALPAATALAQTLPVVELLVSGTSVAENYDCITPGAVQINAGVRTGLSGSLTVRVAAITVSGPDRFSERHGGKFLNKADGTGPIAAKNANIKGFAEMTLTTNGLRPTGLCWKDDNLDTGDSEVMIVIVNGPGYTVHPTEGRAYLTITDNDDCANPAGTPGGVVYQRRGGSSCTCATESQHSSVRRALDRPKTITTPGMDRTLGTDDDGTADVPPPGAGFLSRLAGMFHDPSYLYCAESPYRGLPE